jgi:CheY-like chemotaxis protein
MNSEKKILIIDDIEENLLLLKYILNKSHPEYIILMAKPGREGIEIAKSELPETILLDIFMPEMDGYETCRILKSTKKTSNIPILMVSAAGQSSEVRLEGLRAGADAIISITPEKEEF